MKQFELERRTFLAGAGSLAMLPMLKQAIPSDSNASHSGLVMGPTDGEHLIHFRDGGDIFIRFGSDRLGIGTQQVKVGTGIPTHRHPQMEEAFYVLKGSGIVTLNDKQHPFEPGSTISIPTNVWHGFANPDHELLIMWIVTPPDLAKFFRETCSAPGEPPKNLSREEIRRIALKYGTEFR